MDDTERTPAPNEAPATEPAARPAKPKRSEAMETLSFLVKLAVIVFIVRSFFFSPFNIPSESMMPRLLIGDYLFITKWNYGYSRYSLPFNLPLIPGRILARDPTPGDVVVFKAPPLAKDDWIKRVIGLPGDTIQMHGGVLFLNGKAVPKQRVADFVLPITPNFPEERCKPEFDDVVDGKPVCRIPQFRETLPNGRSYLVLDQGLSEADDTDLYRVPAGHVFLMGDNRDNSTDSRFSWARGGISYVPMANIEGRAAISFWSTDGSANWFLPWTWFSAARWSRIGHGY